MGATDMGATDKPVFGLTRGFMLLLKTRAKPKTALSVAPLSGHFQRFPEQPYVNFHLFLEPNPTSSYRKITDYETCGGLNIA